MVLHAHRGQQNGVFLLRTLVRTSLDPPSQLSTGASSPRFTVQHRSNFHPKPDTLLGGFVAVLAFAFNHGEATRVQWTPPLRESFAFPMIIAQIAVVTYILK
ncbi:hypothetical protein ANCDUO_02322 [Ancylostoma duodenale]|uniref:Uncharacterized protein n=1 Tax=Ancylostoma duodenale TaxID=51022 RepID=A0A0C2DWT9_9BILA|nr:hypothetical protein ANCDUO_02322 [Ancylostoma duodenale]